MRAREWVVVGCILLMVIIFCIRWYEPLPGERMTEQELLLQQQKLTQSPDEGSFDSSAWDKSLARAASITGVDMALQLSPTNANSNGQVRGTFGRFSTVEVFDERTDQDWIPVMERATISKVESFRPRDAYADKYIVTLPGGKKAMMKLVEKHSLFDRGLPMISFDPDRNEGAERAESGKYQGFPELAAFHLDRILGFYRKPPIVGRIVDSSLLWPSTWTSLLPSHDVPVTLHAWVDDLVTRYPAVEVYDFLIGVKSAPRQLFDYAADISDVLLFDFLVDDHDRQAEKNWVEYGKDGRLLIWDNGLAFNHGPVGGGFCLDILCGANIWRRTRQAITGKQQCERICRFRASTIEHLRGINDAEDEHVKLGYRLKQALSESPLFPGFDYLTYYGDSTESEVVRFHYDEFFDGVDVRLQRLLDHVDGCVHAFGESQVLLNVD